MPFVGRLYPVYRVMTVYTVVLNDSLARTGNQLGRLYHVFGR